MTDFKVGRQQLADAARSLLGVRFRHQGRSAETGVDCVGLLVVIGHMIGYPEIFDVQGYRRWPDAGMIRTMMMKNCDEIPIDEVRKGDIYLMSFGTREARHAAIRVSDDLDLAAGAEPQLIHAKGAAGRGAVVIEPVRQWRPLILAGFRIRGLTEDTD